MQSQAAIAFAHGIAFLNGALRWVARFQDWEAERQLECMQVVIPALGGISAHCQQRDQAFWPQGLGHEHLPIQPEIARSVAGSNVDQDAMDAFEHLGFSRGCA